MKRISNLFKEKVHALVTIEVTTVSIQTDIPASMMICWTRGPQRDESAKFEVEPSKADYEIVHTFSRCSTLFKDKSSAITPKLSSIELVTDQETVGSIEVELGQYLGKSNEAQTFEL